MTMPDCGITLKKVYAVTGKDRISDAVSLCCHRNKINAVQDYLKSLPEWDGVPRVETLYIDYLGAADSAYTRAVARTSLTAAVARAMIPGIKYDYMPVLAGPQGLGKSTLLRLLAPKWFNDSLTTFDGKDAYETIQGSWIMELAELVGMSKADDNKIKQFLSKQEDIFREPYGRRTGGTPEDAYSSARPTKKNSCGTIRETGVSGRWSAVYSSRRKAYLRNWRRMCRRSGQRHSHCGTTAKSCICCRR